VTALKPMPVGVVGQHAQIDEFRDVMVEQGNQLSHMLAERGDQLSQMLVGQGSRLSRMLATEITQLRLETRMAIDAQRAIYTHQSEYLCKLLIYALSAQTALLIITLVILRFV